jgi:hypothetical protein
MPDGAVIWKFDFGRKRNPHAQQCCQHEPKIRSLSFALVENWFTTPSISDKGICGIVMAT